jgi:phosphoribosylaminoimidazolecarboxamide formyltransferase/IMP cyclohydrolase
MTLAGVIFFLKTKKNMQDIIKIKRALISVSDKSGLLPLAQCLAESGCEIISTGGTAKFLQEHNLAITGINKITGNSEAFSGRMKTISFQVESAILFDREKDKAEAEDLGIKSIDMVVCNLYPFEKYLNQNYDPDTLIENIDVGGPTMIRSAAKNFKFVTVLCNPNDYNAVIDELNLNDCGISFKTRKKLMTDAFNITADYDSVIASAMDKFNGEESLRLSFKGGKELRYGENPHQQAMIFRESKADASLFDIEVLNGIELSYNNILDVNAAIESVSGLQSKGCAVIKHNNPCGLAQGEDDSQVLRLVWNGDSVSAFGGVVAFNSPVNLSTVLFFNFGAQEKKERKFIEIIAAPEFSEEALEYLSKQKKLRVIRFNPELTKNELDLKFVNGALLSQTKDNRLYEKLEVVTKATFDFESMHDLLLFGLHAVRQVKSNAIVTIRKTDGCYQLLGIGAGQPNRLNSIRLALEKTAANLHAEGKNSMDDVILFSDAFFPFEDNVKFSNQYGIKIIVQPGGSIRDQQIIGKCDQLGISMIFTGTRHFKH